MRKHAFSIGLAVVTLGLVLGLTNLRAAPASAPPGAPVTAARYRLSLSEQPRVFFLLDTATGQVWRADYYSPTKWYKFSMPPGLDDQTQTPVEATTK